MFDKVKQEVVWAKLKNTIVKWDLKDAFWYIFISLQN